MSTLASAGDSRPSFPARGISQKYQPTALSSDGIAAAGNPGAEIEVDGGIDMKTAARVVEAGARILVAGNAVFGTPNPEQATRDLKALANGVLTGHGAR